MLREDEVILKLQVRPVFVQGGAEWDDNDGVLIEQRLRFDPGVALEPCSSRFRALCAGIG